MAGQEDTVDGNDFSRFKQGDITDDEVFRVDLLLGAVPDDLDGTVFSLGVEFLELTFFLVIGKGSDEDNDDDGDDDGDTLDPFERGHFASFRAVFVDDNVRGTGGGGLVDTEREGYDGGDSQQHLHVGQHGGLESCTVW